MLKRDYSLYVVLSLSAAILSFYKFGYLASTLSSEDFGLYSIIIISFVYICYLGGLGGSDYVLKLGSMTASDKQSELFMMRNNAIFYGLLGVLVVSLIVLLVSYLFFSIQIYYSMLAVVALAICTLPYNVFESYYRATQASVVFSGMLLAKAVLVIIGIYIFIDDFGFIGVLYSELTALTMIVAFCVAKNFKVIRLSGLQKPRLAINKMLRNGFYISVSNLLRNISVTADRYIVVFFLGVYSLGVYSFVMILYQGGVLCSGIIMNIFGPYLIKRYSSNPSRRGIAALLWKVVASLAVIAVCFFPLFANLTKSVVGLFFQNYNNADVYFMLNMIYVASIASFFVFLLDWFFICISKEYLISMLSLFSFILILVSVILFSFLDVELKHYVLFFMVVRVTVFFVMTVLVVRCAGSEA